MALTIKPLNSDASFLLSFEPLLPEAAQGTVTPRPFTILLDPWLTGPSEIFHKAISVSTQKQAPCVTSLLDLAEPDLVVISQYKSDHCNEATLRQLPARNTKTLILAEPAAAKLIRSWKHFDNSKVRTIPRWQDPRLTGKQAVLRVPVPAVAPGGHRGEVTIAFIPQKRDIAGLHAAIGITYRPPSTHNLAVHPQPSSYVLTPPTTPGALKTVFIDARGPLMATDGHLMPPSPPASSHSLRSYRSASSIAASPAVPLSPGEMPTSRPRPVSSLYSSHVLNISSTPTVNQSLSKIPSTTLHCHPVSVIFSPHGISYSELEPYATSHLVSEAALPLTALLHCMNSVDNPWWMGGNINSGAPGGAVIAAKLGARVWVGAHDGDKDIRGLATGFLKTKMFKKSEMRQVVAKASLADLSNTRSLATPPQSPTREIGMAAITKQSDMGPGTQILKVNSGEEVLVSGDGAMLWCPGIVEDDDNERMNADYDHTVSASVEKRMRNDKTKLDTVSPLKPNPWLGRETRLKARASMSFLATRLKM
ncbi:hypothetical protein Micbo1qcDRAFT_192665 [Microdochium bolleyi]|uniref:Beta-lactamase superfamily domain-domain-containing protein n=1 Tax=Microdochium bolleyi TaxID=196109 RepID=A0A136JF02_9PEZI|nr:hypothetical protein Micbo1qcDRAFT_192665 [Microdochium bolleyi]